MSCEGRRLPGAGSSYYRSSSSAPAPTQVQRLFTERSSASEKLVFKIRVIRRPRVQMDGFVSVCFSLTAEHMMLAIKRRAALYTTVAFRDQGAMSSSVLP